MLAEYIDAIIMLLVGAYATAVGFGKLAAPWRAGAISSDRFPNRIV